VTWVFTETVDMIAGWTRTGRDMPMKPINLSATEFEDPGRVDRFAEIIIDPARIQIEPTERVLVRNPDAALGTIRGFRRRSDLASVPHAISVSSALHRQVACAQAPR
jgi:EAL domain-containing protein (putative c-di-GMP-specific phosphodiesterase class I)